MSSRTAHCPKCNAILRLPPGGTGPIKAACPKCGAKISIAAPAATQVAAGEPKARPMPKASATPAKKRSLVPFLVIGGALLVLGIPALCLAGGAAFWLMARVDQPIADRIDVKEAVAFNDGGKDAFPPKDKIAVKLVNEEPKDEPEAEIVPEPRLAFRYGPNMRFGITVLKDAAGRAVNKKLTYDADGLTNHAMVRIDGVDVEFGGGAGKWLTRDVKDGNVSKSVWTTRGIEIAQIIEIVPSKQAVETAPRVRKRLLDTCVIRYEIVNKDQVDHTVGMRIMVDTLIGNNDGVPFAVPTVHGLVDTFKDFTTAEDVPDFVQALEVPNLQNPGTVRHMTFKLGDIEAPARVSLTRWPPFVPSWEVPVQHMANDSAVILYWHADRAIAPSGKRTIGFAYGLGQVSAGEGTGKLAITVNGSFVREGILTVTAYVQKPGPNQTLTLDLPPGFEFLRCNPTETVSPLAPGQETSIVTWTIRAGDRGKHQLRVRSSTGIAQTQDVTIRAK